MESNVLKLRMNRGSVSPFFGSVSLSLFSLSPFIPLDLLQGR